MRRNPAWAGLAASKPQPKGARSIACLLFVALLGGAFWAGALWAAAPWLK